MTFVGGYMFKCAGEESELGLWADALYGSMRPFFYYVIYTFIYIK